MRSNIVLQNVARYPLRTNYADKLFQLETPLLDKSLNVFFPAVAVERYKYERNIEDEFRVSFNLFLLVSVFFSVKCSVL